MTAERRVDSVEERRAWLALWRIPGIGPQTFARLLEHCGSIAPVFSLPRAELQRLQLPPAIQDALREPPWEQAEADLRWLERPGRHLLTWGDPGYPQQLQDIPAAPPLLFALGDPALLQRPQLAIVGSRNPTAGGVQIAEQFAEHLAAAGLAITSGLAEGIDAAAHRGALAGGGATIAVTATGLDRVYPARNRDLAHAIAERGCLVSEFPPGTPARRDHFPRRNRIISGLALGTLVVEAGVRSGSLITARYTLEQGREVFAIPGSIHNPLSKGCHALIRNGAKLTETIDDILDELPWRPAAAGTPAAEPVAEPELDDDYRRLLDALGYDPVPLETLLQRTGLTPAEVSSMLLVLELKGLVSAAPGGRYSRAQ
ncbi:MAG: DNA-protecting protein DprA [Xanthomonadaceae bacterium]|nr:DNA-protecting protein DprA [Xanthomonadaceae bacterium]